LPPFIREWFQQSFAALTDAQQTTWQQVDQSRNTLLLAPTGSGKTLAAFLVAISRIAFGEQPVDTKPGVRVLYISPLKALGVDVERSLRAPIAGVRARNAMAYSTICPPSQFAAAIHPPRIAPRCCVGHLTF